MMKTKDNIKMLIIATLALIFIHGIYMIAPKTTTLPLGTVLLAIVVYRLVLIRYSKRNDKISYRHNYKLNHMTSICLIIWVYIIKHLMVIIIGINNTANERRIINELQQQTIGKSIFLSSVRAPIIEEICWRGLLFIICIMVARIILKNFSNRVKDTSGILLFMISSTFIFAYLHLTNEDNFSNIIPYAIGGLAFVFVFLISKSIIVAIAIHALSNFISILENLHDYHMTYYNWSDVIYSISGVIGVITLCFLISRSMWKKRQLKKTNITITNDIDNQIMADTLLQGSWLGSKFNKGMNK